MGDKWIVKLLIWGTGKIAERIVRNGLKEQQIVGYIETIKTKEVFNGKRVFALSEIPSESVFLFPFKLQ